MKKTAAQCYTGKNDLRNGKALMLAFLLILVGFGISTVFAQTGKEDNIGGGTALKASSFYLTTTESNTTKLSSVKTTIHSCDSGDIAIGGGMYKFENSPDAWKLIQSAPDFDDTSKWITTVEYESADPTRFWLSTKCIDLPPHRK